MKRKNLILSLVCSIALTIGLVVFTVVSLVPGINNNSVNIEGVTDITDPTVQEEINKERDGSIEKPYIIYDVKSFNEFVVGKYLDENGEYINYNEKDSNGDLVYPKLAEGLNYELANNIDFANSLVCSIFNKGIAFNGVIDGKGFELSNITIEVSKENLNQFMYLENGKGFKAHIALFGELDDAKIVNLAVKNINVTIKSEVLDYLRDSETTFVEDNKAIMYELVSSLFAGIAFDSEIDVDVQGKLDAFAYCYREDDKASGTNAIGGLVGSAVNTNVSKSETNVELIVDGKNYFVGGLIGKAYNITANEIKVDLSVSATHNQTIYVGGLAGYSAGISVDGAEVNLVVTEKAERISNDVLALLSSEKIDEQINIAGLIPFIRANDESQKTILKNANVIADVKIDSVYAGAFIEVWSTAKETLKTVYVENVSLASNVDVLKAYGFVKNIVNTEIKSKLASDQAGYDIKIVGKVRFNEKAFYFLARYIDDIASTLGADSYNTLTIMLDKNLSNELSFADSIIVKRLISENRLDLVSAE